jgi:AcrR family transcriptional regulator
LQYLQVSITLTTVSTAPGLRERKKAGTRLAIARAALRLAVEHGPDAVTVDAIADEAGVSPRTVFNYFATKEEAIVGFDPHRSVEIADAVRDRPAREAPLTAVRTVFIDIATATPEAAELARARVALIREYPELHRSYLASTSSLENELVDAIAQRTGLDPERSSYPRLVVSTAIAAFRIALGRAGHGEAAVAAAIDEAFDSLASGLRPPR